MQRGGGCGLGGACITAGWAAGWLRCLQVRSRAAELQPVPAAAASRGAAAAGAGRAEAALAGCHAALLVRDGLAGAAQAVRRAPSPLAAHARRCWGRPGRGAIAAC